MPYSDLYSTADLYYSFNGNANYTTTGTLTSSTTGSMGRQYINSHPTNLGGGQALRLLEQPTSAESATNTTEVFTLPKTTSYGTLSFGYWVYRDSNIEHWPLLNVLGQAVRQNYIWDGLGGNVSELPNQWTHYFWTSEVDTNGVLQRKAYINGILHYATSGITGNTTTPQTTWQSPDYLTEYSSSINNVNDAMCHFAIWNNKCLSPLEVYELANYGNPEKNSYAYLKNMEVAPSIYIRPEGRKYGYTGGYDTNMFYYGNNYGTDKTCRGMLFTNMQNADGTYVQTNDQGYFDGKSAYFHGSTSPSGAATGGYVTRNPYNKTFAFWFKPIATNSQGQVLISRKAAASIPGVTQVSYPRWQIRNGASGLQFIIGGGEQTGLGYFMGPSDPNFYLNKWHHVAFNISGSDGIIGNKQVNSRLKVWIDGTLMVNYSMAIPGSFTPDGQESWHTARDYDDANFYVQRFFNTSGTITSANGSMYLDSFMAWDSVLTDYQMQNLYKMRNQVKAFNGTNWEWTQMGISLKREEGFAGQGSGRVLNENNLWVKANIQKPHILAQQ